MVLMYHFKIVQDFVTCFFFFNDTATTEIYTLSLHDALPICIRGGRRVLPRILSRNVAADDFRRVFQIEIPGENQDRKSTRLNSSHLVISYAVFCLKKKKNRHPLKFSPTAIIALYLRHTRLIP